jgi:hypothetical protein
MTIAEPRYDEYLLVLSGSVEVAPFLADWKALKDSVRENAGDPGWADASPTSHEGIQRAWCNLSSEGKAGTAYSMQYDLRKQQLALTGSVQDTTRSCWELGSA